MRIFLSYSGEDGKRAEDISIRLKQDGHDVFLDRQQLAAGEEYDAAIRKEIARCDLFIYLISPESVADGTYALTELGMAQKRWPDPSGHLLPVMIRPTPLENVPSYASAVTILNPKGNAVAETAAEVARIAGDSGRARQKRLVAAAGLVIGIAAVITIWQRTADDDIIDEQEPPCFLSVQVAALPSVPSGLTVRVSDSDKSRDFSVGQSGKSDIDVSPDQLPDWRLDVIDRDGQNRGEVEFDGCPAAGAIYEFDGGLSVAVSPRL